MQASSRQQCRHRRIFCIHVTVRQHDQVRTFIHRFVSSSKKFFQRQLETGCAVRRLEQNRQGHRFEVRPVLCLDLRKVGIRQHRTFNPDPLSITRLRIGNVAFRTQHDDGRGHQLFTQGINRRIGHLSKQLFKIVIQQLCTVRENGQRRIITHGASRFTTVTRHRQQQHTKLFEGIPEGLLTLNQLVTGQTCDRTRIRKVFQEHAVISQPLRIRMRINHALLHFRISNDLTLLGVDHKHTTRLKAAFIQHVFRLDIHHANFGAHDDVVIFGHVVTRRTQTVTIQTCTHHLTISNRDRCRTIPRLHQAAVILIEGLLVRRHRGVLLPRLRNHHHRRMRQAPTREV